MTLLTEIEAEALATAAHRPTPVLDRTWLEAQVRALIEDAEEEIDPTRV